MKLTTDFHLVLRLRMSGAVPLLPLYSFVMSSGKTLPYTIQTVLSSVKGHISESCLDHVKLEYWRWSHRCMRVESNLRITFCGGDILLILFPYVVQHALVTAPSSTKENTPGYTVQLLNTFQQKGKACSMYPLQNSRLFGLSQWLKITVF